MVKNLERTFLFPPCWEFITWQALAVARVMKFESKVVQKNFVKTGKKSYELVQPFLVRKTSCNNEMDPIDVIKRCIKESNVWINKPSIS